jgi:uncharacterized protein YigE (DUF2233 family)
MRAPQAFFLSLILSVAFGLAPNAPGACAHAVRKHTYHKPSYSSYHHPIHRHWSKRNGTRAIPAHAPLPSHAPLYQKLTAGVIHQTQLRHTPAGPMMVNVLRVDSRHADIRTLLAERQGGGFGRKSVSSIAHAAGAVAAINGSFFSMISNEPSGLLVLDGQIVSSAPYNRSVFGIRYDGSPFIDDAAVEASVLLDDGRQLSVARVNRRAKPGQLTLYTPHYGLTTGTNPQVDRCEIAIDANGWVVGLGSGHTLIPKGGAVISGQGISAPMLAQALPLGSRGLIYTRLAGVWEGVRYAVGGGPTIVQDGKVHVTAHQEGFGGAVASGRAPRTAIGYTSSGQILMVTVDGRHPHYSVGCTLYELARLMVSLGASNAINLDGGGSSTMVVAGKTVNRVSAGQERLVSNAIGIFPHN